MNNEEKAALKLLFIPFYFHANETNLNACLNMRVGNAIHNIYSSSSTSSTADLPETRFTEVLKQIEYVSCSLFF